MHSQNPSLLHPVPHVTFTALHSLVSKTAVHLLVWSGFSIPSVAPLQQQYIVGPWYLAGHTPFSQGYRRNSTWHEVEALPNRGVVVVDVVEVEVVDVVDVVELVEVEVVVGVVVEVVEVVDVVVGVVVEVVEVEVDVVVFGFRVGTAFDVAGGGHVGFGLHRRRHGQHSSDSELLDSQHPR